MSAYRNARTGTVARHLPPRPPARQTNRPSLSARPASTSQSPRRSNRRPARQTYSPFENHAMPLSKPSQSANTNGNLAADHHSQNAPEPIVYFSRGVSGNTTCVYRAISSPVGINAPIISAFQDRISHGRMPLQPHLHGNHFRRRSEDCPLLLRRPGTIPSAIPAAPIPRDTASCKRKTE